MRIPLQPPPGDVRVIDTFTFPGSDDPIAVVVFDNAPHKFWFYAADVCRVVGLAKPGHATRYLPDYDRQLIDHRRILNSHAPYRTGVNPIILLISESGLYRMLMRSTNPAAHRFQAWIAEEVVPAIRQSAGQSLALTESFQIPQNYAAALRAHADEVERRERAERGLAAQAITIESHEQLTRGFSHMMSTEGTFSVAESAKALRRDPRIDTGETRLFTFMERHNLIFRSGRKRAWEAYQTAIDKKLLEMAVSEYKDSAGTVHKKMQIRVTLKGQLWLWGLYTGRIGEVPPPAVLELPQ